ncbi:hypothetical protein ACFL59_08650 [Planctomycetota bacterium]
MTQGRRSGGPIETPTVTLSLREDNIVLVLLKEGAEIDLEAAEVNHKATLELTGDRDFLILVDTRKAIGINREAREFFADPNVRRNTIAQAILIDSGISRVLGNFFIGLNKPAFPTRLFTAEREAVAWLKGHVE